MYLSKERVQKRLEALQIAYVEAKKNVDEIMGSIKECKVTLDVMNMPELKEDDINEPKPERSSVISEIDRIINGQEKVDLKLVK
jgi:hypothetical protein